MRDTLRDTILEQGMWEVLILSDSFGRPLDVRDVAICVGGLSQLIKDVRCCKKKKVETVSSNDHEASDQQIGKPTTIQVGNWPV
jgi:hypothetical protein